ncbi:hypothetical protein EV183_004975 [Coemansia sp. RSA 2336]|nr:hypothetical protein EV183_004975 [Coemansia sp. RSA 2336]
MDVAAALARHIRGLAELGRSQAFRREIGRMLVAWGVLFVVGIWMVVCQQWSDTRWLRRWQEQTQQTAATQGWPASALLQDQVLEHLPVLERAWISDKLVGTSVLGSMLGCSLLAGGWRQRVMLIRRLGWMVAVLYLLRSLTISVTTMPPSSAACAIAAQPQSTWQVILATPDILAGSVGQCTDKIFSGHTAILTISFLFWRRYATHWAFVAYSAVHTAAGILSVLLARYHYSIDVLVGLVFTVMVHHFYYALLASATLPMLLPAFGEPGMDCAAAGSMYSMALLAPKDVEDWRDHDSVMNVDIGSSSSSTGPHSPPRPLYDGQHVRKRDNCCMPSLPDSDTEESHRLHDVIEIGHSELLSVDQQQLASAGVSCRWACDAGISRKLALLLGVNQPFSTALACAVAWMDGLDIRIND